MFAQVGRSVVSGKRLDNLRRRLRAEHVTFQHMNSTWGLTYQCCRFCGVAAYTAPAGGLWKYGVRHYICNQCRSDADPLLRKEGRP